MRYFPIVEQLSTILASWEGHRIFVMSMFMNIKMGKKFTRYLIKCAWCGFNCLPDVGITGDLPASLQIPTGDLRRPSTVFAKYQLVTSMQPVGLGSQTTAEQTHQRLKSRKFIGMEPDYWWYDMVVVKVTCISRISDNFFSDIKGLHMKG